MLDDRLVCRWCGRLFDNPQAMRLFGTEEPVPEFCPKCEHGLKVEVTSYYGEKRLLGCYVFKDGVLRWQGEIRADGSAYGEPFDGGAVRASSRMEDGWIKTVDDPERWLRAVPDYLAMRGHLGAKIVADPNPRKEASRA
jgi:hypothetical protein